MNNDHLVATGRQAGGAAVATGVLALATIAMITEFIVYSGFTPKVTSILKLYSKLHLLFQNHDTNNVHTLFFSFIKRFSPYKKLVHSRVD